MLEFNLKPCWDCIKSNDGYPCHNQSLQFSNFDQTQCSGYISGVELSYAAEQFVGACGKCLRKSCHFKRDGETKQFCDNFIGED